MTIDATYDALKYQIVKYGTYTEYQNIRGQTHRTDGPAIIYNSGTREWWENGKRHREDGPAVIWGDGNNEWYANGKRHRIGGPAIIWGECVQWWIDGEELTEEEFNERIK